MCTTRLYQENFLEKIKHIAKETFISNYQMQLNMKEMPVWLVITMNWGNETTRFLGNLNTWGEYWGMNPNLLLEEFEDTKEVIRICKSKIPKR